MFGIIQDVGKGRCSTLRPLLKWRSNLSKLYVDNDLRSFQFVSTNMISCSLVVINF